MPVIVVAQDEWSPKTGSTVHACPLYTVVSSDPWNQRLPPVWILSYSIRIDMPLGRSPQMDTKGGREEGRQAGRQEGGRNFM